MANNTDPKTIAAVDKLFNAWLALNNILSSGGYLFKADKSGKMLHDMSDKPIKVNANEFNLLMKDPVKGFKAFAAQRGIRVNPIQHDFPENT